MKKLMLVLTGMILFARPALALDKDAFAIHLRKALNVDTRVEIKIASEPAPSGIGDLNVLMVSVGGGSYPVYITKDEKQYIWGFAVDATTDPDKNREKGINLKHVHAHGSANAPITIVEYSDLECSHCKQAHDTLKTELYKAYKPEQVRLVYKHFPLMGHEWAEQAAAATECAAAQKESSFWTMEDYFFSNQDKITKDNITDRTLAEVKQIGLDQSAFQKCMSSNVMLQKVQADKKEGVDLGVNSTPTIFVNGRMRRGFRDFDDIKVVIEEKLAELKK